MLHLKRLYWNGTKKIWDKRRTCKCNQLDFVAKNGDFTCESHSELVNHNDRYYHSHRRTLNKENEKLILDEFQQLDDAGFLIHRKLDW